MDDIYKIFLMGPQGSGKGTQGELLSKHLGLPILGTGQLIREEIATGSEFGKKLQKIVLAGDLVSDVDAVRLLKDRLSHADTARGYLLDGYPRNLEQMAAFTFDKPTHVIVLEIPREESLRRLGGRLTCRPCNKVASVHTGIKVGDPCPCGGNWYQREDDTPEAIAHRLAIYEHDTAAVIAEYEKQGIVHRIDGVGSIEEVDRRILDALSYGIHKNT